MDEPDGVAGVMALQQSEPSLEQRILALEISGKLSDAAACYETMNYPLQPHHFKVSVVDLIFYNSTWFTSIFTILLLKVYVLL